MGADTGIEWCDHTFNPWIGCQAVSAACDRCYAERLVNGRMGGDFSKRRLTSTANWRQPMKWDRKAGEASKRARVFCASLADVFDNQADPAWRCDLWDLIWQTPHLDWLLLTKRPMNIAKMLPSKAAGALADWGDGWPNVWLGTTVEDQAEADRRIPHLLAVPARVRFLSCEPLLGPVDLRPVLWSSSSMNGTPFPMMQGPRPGEAISPAEVLDWVISGGESGLGARPSHPAWHRNLRDQCADAGVAYFFKQWGEWLPIDQPGAMDLPSRDQDFLNDEGLHCHRGMATAELRRVGKKAAGGLLDGVLHRAFPNA